MFNISLISIFDKHGLLTSLFKLIFMMGNDLTLLITSRTFLSTSGSSKVANSKILSKTWVKWTKCFASPSSEIGKTDKCSKILESKVISLASTYESINSVIGFVSGTISS